VEVVEVVGRRILDEMVAQGVEQVVVELLQVQKRLEQRQQVQVRMVLLTLMQHMVVEAAVLVGMPLQLFQE
jgi:hypothetical protein